MEREPHAAILETHIGKGGIADDGVDSPLGQFRVAEALNPDVVTGVESPGDASGDGIKLNTDKPHAVSGLGEEVSAPAAGLEHGRILGDPEATERRVHRLHN